MIHTSYPKYNLELLVPGASNKVKSRVGLLHGMLYVRMPSLLKVVDQGEKCCCQRATSLDRLLSIYSALDVALGSFFAGIYFLA